MHLAEPSTLLPVPRTEPGASESFLNPKGCALVSLFTGHLLNPNGFVHFKDLPAGGELKSSGVGVCVRHWSSSS